MSKLTQVSPSQATKLNGCAFRLTLDSGGNHRLLPSNPKAILGEISHNLIEQANKGVFGGDVTFEALGFHWDSLVTSKEYQLKSSVLDSRFVPLARSHENYALIKRRSCEHALAAASWPSTSSTGAGDRRFGSEVKVSFQGVLPIKGKIDWIGVENGQVVLRDLKTGRYTDESGDIRLEYISQLLLYAALYSNKFEVWPDRLEVIPLTGTPEHVEFTHAQAQAELSKTLELAVRRNEEIAKSAKQPLRLAAASAACSSCDWRPACPVYWEHHEFQREGDFEGTVEAIEGGRFATSTWRVALADGGQVVLRNLTRALVGSDDDFLGRRVRILGSLPERQSKTNYRSGQQLVVYSYNSEEPLAFEFLVAASGG